MRNQPKLKHKIRTSSDLSRHLGVPESHLARILAQLDKNESALYRSRDEPKPSGGTRPIDVPREELKELQKAINRSLLQRIQVNKAAVGGVRGKGMKDNLAPHVGKEMVATYDLKSFFSNISDRQVHNLFVKMGTSVQVARILTRLTTFKNRLPQGAPTSPMLANLVAGYAGAPSLDSRLQRLGKTIDSENRRWIDDIAISGPGYLPRLGGTVERIVKQSGFTTNKEKTKFASKDEPQSVTGHLVNAKPNVKKKTRRDLRALLHNCKTGGPDFIVREALRAFRSSLRGKIAHLENINPVLGARYLEQFNAIEWPGSKDS